MMADGNSRQGIVDGKFARHIDLDGTVDQSPDLIGHPQIARSLDEPHILSPDVRLR